MYLASCGQVMAQLVYYVPGRPRNFLTRETGSEEKSAIRQSQEGSHVQPHSALSLD